MSGHRAPCVGCGRRTTHARRLCKPCYMRRHNDGTIDNYPRAVDDRPPPPPPEPVPDSCAPDPSDGNCADPRHDPELWFRHSKAGRHREQYHEDAVFLCNTCPIREACLQYALQEPIPEGLWGGLGWTQRRALHRAARRGVTV